ncbi:hypothetical protein [Egicoccus sp. AB-alg6-2]|uniref:hypothetical protein n=1 Tax=Egicoccus sp. AB-alg6-2 TaxID=3242692 RepID=UPI00359D4690
MADHAGALQAFDFEFDRRYQPLLRLAGVTPSTAQVVVGRGPQGVLRARFGPWLLTTTLDNVADVTVGGPYRAHRVVGPHLSLADRGVTFGTNTRAGVCVRFHEPVGALAGRDRLPHPGMTVTVADPNGFAQLLRVRAGLA